MLWFDHRGQWKNLVTESCLGVDDNDVAKGFDCFDLEKTNWEFLVGKTNTQPTGEFKCQDLIRNSLLVSTKKMEGIGSLSTTLEVEHGIESTATWEDCLSIS